MARPGIRRAASGVSSAAASLLGAGAGGLEELNAQLSDDAVGWALLRWEVGSGTFVRSKLVAIHFNGEDVPVVRRGRLNARSGEVMAMLGEAHATLEVKRKEDLHLDFVCERLMNVLTSDAMEKSMSAEALRKDYEAKIETQKRKVTNKEKSFRGPRTAKDNPSKQITVDRALQAVGDATGPYNWALLEPEKLELHNAGYGGLLEMKEWLSEDLVLFGVMRFTFGRDTVSSMEGMAATPKLVKYIFVHWVGPKVSAVRRGKWNAKQQQADAQVRSICSITFRREAHTLDDLDLADLISELWRLSVVDGAVSDAGRSQISVEEYMASLALEQQMQMEAEFQELEDKEPPEMELGAAVASVREAGGEMNWVLLGMKKPADKEATGRETKAAEEKKAKEAEDAKAKKAEEEKKAKEAEDAKAKKAEEEKKAKEAEDAKAKKAEEEKKAKEADDAEAKKAEEEKKAKDAADAEAKKAEEEKAKDAADAEAKKAEEEKKAKDAADAEANKAEEEKAILAAAALAKKAEEERKAKEAEDAKAKKTQEEKKAKDAADAEAKKVEEEKKAIAAAAIAKAAEEKAKEGTATETKKAGAEKMTMQAVAAEAKKAEEEKKTKAATSAEAKKAEQQKKARSSVASSHSLSSRPARDASGKDLTGQDEPRLTGKLKLKTGWGWWWARRHVELKCGKLQWWRKEPQGPPDVELRLSDGVTRWVLTRHEGNIMELMSENHSNAVKDGERVLLRASSEGEAQQWAQALQEQIQYVEMLLAWPMPMDGRQGDIRFYGVEYP